MKTTDKLISLEDPQATPQWFIRRQSSLETDPWTDHVNMFHFKVIALQCYSTANWQSALKKWGCLNKSSQSSCTSFLSTDFIQKCVTFVLLYFYMSLFVEVRRFAHPSNGLMQYIRVIECVDIINVGRLKRVLFFCF